MSLDLKELISTSELSKNRLLNNINNHETLKRAVKFIHLIVVFVKLDFVDDPGAVLENMKANHIGNRRSLFYQAYALYYEKLKKFTDAEKMYHLGVQK